MVEFKFVIVFTKRLEALQRGVLKSFISDFLIRMESFQLQLYQSTSRKILQVADYLQLSLQQIFWKGIFSEKKRKYFSM